MFSYVFFIPKINLTIPRNGFGTFFTTIVIGISSYFSNIFLIPNMIKHIEIIHNHIVGGKININSIPKSCT